MRYYIILDSKSFSSVEFGAVDQSRGKIRYNRAREKFILSYIDNQPEFVFSKITFDLIGVPEFDQSQMVEIVGNGEW